MTVPERRAITGACGLGLALVLVVASARDGHATTTLANLAAVETAIDSAMGAFTAAAADLGGKSDHFVNNLAAAKGDVEKAASAVAQGDRRGASAALRKAMRKVIPVGFRLRSLHARKTLPDATRQALLAQVQPIEKQLRALRKDL